MLQKGVILQPKPKKKYLKNIYNYHYFLILCHTTKQQTSPLMETTNKPVSPKMDRLIQVRVNESQYTKLLERATKNNLNVSDYVRKAATGKAK
jgi:hypothetical protein